MLLAALALGSAIAPPARAAPADSQPSAWSPIVNGLQGRLFITESNELGAKTSFRTDGDMTFCVYLELQNVGVQRIRIPLFLPYTRGNRVFEMKLVDSTGASLQKRRGILGMDVGVGVEWILLPSDATYRFHLTDAHYEAASDQTLFAGLTIDLPWVLSGHPPYLLSCTFRPQTESQLGLRLSLAKEIPEPYDRWTDVLEIPGVRLPDRKAPPSPSTHP